ncbi:MAG TPA: WYL domain-containing transcriptional regulator [Streptosporangiaceae bacterium]
MTRTERLLALAAELRAAAPAPLRARALAERLAVSERTVQRDIAALARSGLAVRRESSGGYAVRPDQRPGEVAASTTGLLQTLAAAVRDRRIVRIAYVDQAGEQTRRDIEAHGLVIAPAADYLVGWCRLRDDDRLFRVDRIAAAHLVEGERMSRRHNLEDLIAALEVPAPRVAAGQSRGTPARARAWALARIRTVRLRLVETADEVSTAREGGASLRAVIGHLAEWTRWQVAAVRAVTTGQDLVFDGRRPAFPREFDGALGYLARERMIQDAMALRSLAELVRDLDEVLAGAAHWAAECPDGLWRDPVPEPGGMGRSRPLADLLAGWWSPLSHTEWHLDRPAGDVPGDTEPDDEPDERLVQQCPLRA